MLGWNDECGVGLTVLTYAKFGEGFGGFPSSTRSGMLTIPVASEEPKTEWQLQADGMNSFKQLDLDKAEKDVKLSGYKRPGFPEVIQDGPIGNQPLLAETILSTSTLKMRITKGLPGPEWRWAGTNYNPLTTCALLVFEKRSALRQYSFILARIYNPRARTDRGYAHASNARLLFNDGELDYGAVEADTAARMAPEVPIARYENAAMLALTGHADQSVSELAAAIKLDSKYAAKARDDEDFAEVRARDDFQALTR